MVAGDSWKRNVSDRIILVGRLTSRYHECWGFRIIEILKGARVLSNRQMMSWRATLLIGRMAANANSEKCK